MHPKLSTGWCKFWAADIVGPFFFNNTTGQILTVNITSYRDMQFFFLSNLGNVVQRRRCYVPYNSRKNSITPWVVSCLCNFPFFWSQMTAQSMRWTFDLEFFEVKGVWQQAHYHPRVGGAERSWKFSTKYCKFNINPVEIIYSICFFRHNPISHTVWIKKNITIFQKKRILLGHTL